MRESIKPAEMCCLTLRYLTALQHAVRTEANFIGYLKIAHAFPAQTKPGDSIFSEIVAESSSISTFRNDCREYRVAIALPRQICYTGNFITRASNAMKFNPLRCRREKKIARVTGPLGI